jgi:two-component system OmpR family sensor kinase
MLVVFVAVSSLASVTTTVFLRDEYSQNVDSQLSTLADGVRSAIERPETKFPDNAWVLSAQSLFIGVLQPGYTSTGAQPVLPDPLPTHAFYETVYSADGASGPYRVYGEPTSGGRTIVVASSLAGLKHAASIIVVVMTIDGVAAVLVMALIGSYLLRRELRPLDQVAEQADLLAASARTGPPSRLDMPAYPESTEIGRMVGALDGMLTELHAALAERDASESRLRQFAADASHELRTPLQSIRGYAELRLAGVMADGPEVDEAMTRIAGEVRRMTGLVESLLALARFDAAHEQDVVRAEVDLTALVSDACRDAAAVQPQRPLHLQAAYGVRVSGDPDQLARLLANLLGNVRMHTPSDTPVEVELRAEHGTAVPQGTAVLASGTVPHGNAALHGTAVLTVRDHGPGIPPDALPHVFDRFYRADKGRSRAAGGSGLGLSIVAATVAAHQGTVHVAAPRDAGAGLLVTVRLPLASAPAETESAVESASASAAATHDADADADITATAATDPAATAEPAADDVSDSLPPGPGDGR